MFLVCQTEAEVRRLSEIFGATRLAARRPPALSPSAICKAGFRLVPERIVLVSGSELFHRADVQRPAAAAGDWAA